jgi:hypothetical protein
VQTGLVPGKCDERARIAGYRFTEKWPHPQRLPRARPNVTPIRNAY